MYPIDLHSIYIGASRQLVNELHAKSLRLCLGAHGTLHGFRHSVMETLIQADVELRKTQYIVGHKGDQSVAEAVYGASKFTMRQLQTATNKLEYGINFEETRYARFLSRIR